MRTLFLLNPTAGKADCTRTLPQQIKAAAARAGLAPEEYTIQVTNHAGHARELANAAAQQARQSGEELRVFTAGGDGTFNEALTGIYGYANAAVGCLPFGSGNDFLRTFGTKEEFLDLVKSLQDSLGTDMELPGELTVDFYINASDFLPSEMTIDMSGMKGDMGETAGEGTSAEMEFTTMVVSYRCSQYNAISEIAYPEDLPTEETSGEEPEAIQDEEVDTEEVSEAGEDELVSEAGQMVESAAGSLAEELGVKGIQETTDTSVTFTDKGSRENPAAMNEMGKVYLYNAISDQYEQVGLTVTGITDGDEATEYVDQLLNAENSYYSFPALKNYEEYRIVNYDLYLPSDFSDEEYGVYAPSAMMSVVSKDDDWLTYNDQSYYAATYGLYEDSNSYHPGDTVHCQCVIVMPKDLTEYELEFGPYGLDYFYVAIQ